MKVKVVKKVQQDEICSCNLQVSSYSSSRFARVLRVGSNFTEGGTFYCYFGPGGT